MKRVRAARWRSGLILFLLGLAYTAVAADSPTRATYDAAGRLTSLIQGGVALPVQTEFIVNFVGGVQASMQPAGHPTPITRDGTKLRWNGSIVFPNGGTATLKLGWTEDDLAGIALDASLYAPSALDTASVDFILDVPRADFSGGHLVPAGAPALDLPTAKPEQITFFNGTTDALTFTDAIAARTLALRLDHPLPITVTDRWDSDGRSFRVRVTLHSGPWDSGQNVKLHAILQAAGPDHAAPAVAIHVDPDQPRYEFDGYGGNYCWGEQPAVSNYLFTHLQHAWTRHELKAIDWDKERDHPGPALVADFEQMQVMQQQGIPWIISIWNLPQRFYSDANQRPPSEFFHPVALDKWDELLDLVGSYLVYLKKNYGAEPDLFSFNEPDLGVYVGQTPEAHRDAIKRFGAYFAQLGLKTKLLLGDTSTAAGTHVFALTTAADPEAMRYVGAISFHNWNKTTPAQYTDWADLADWLRLPLLVTEIGVDSDAYYNHVFDDYDYGLSEAEQQQELLRYARPSASIFWQYTTDYGLAYLKSDGTVAPTSRFWLLKHFSDLTPRHSKVLASASDQEDVRVSAFRRDEAMTVHILNLGATRAATLTGLPPGQWRTVVTTENVDFAEGMLNDNSATSLNLPARSLTTLIRPVP
jgi:hypothetical protein